MAPPWEKHPEIPLGSVGWRMGYDEEYWIAFGEWFARKSLSHKRQYAVQHPEPAGWEGFYRRKGVSE